MKNYLLLTVILIFNSCSLFVNENDGFEDALEKWEEQKTSSYEFEYNVGCFCPQVTPALIIVQDGEIYHILEPESRDSLFLQTGENTFEYAGDLYPTFFHTMDGLFEIIKNARSEAHKLNVTYNRESGFPEKISIDYYKDAIDDEVGYSVSNYFAYRVTTAD